MFYFYRTRHGIATLKRNLLLEMWISSIYLFFFLYSSQSFEVYLFLFSLAVNSTLGEVIHCMNSFSFISYNLVSFSCKTLQDVIQVLFVLLYFRVFVNTSNSTEPCRMRCDTILTKRNTEVEEHVYSKEFGIQGQGSECGLCYSINGIV